jgi:hypothetical protein
MFNKALIPFTICALVRVPSFAVTPSNCENNDCPIKTPFAPKLRAAPVDSPADAVEPDELDPDELELYELEPDEVEPDEALEELVVLLTVIP